MVGYAAEPKKIIYFANFYVRIKLKSKIVPVLK
jgi:hypothetical protein